MGNKRNAYRVSVGKLKGKGQFRRPWRRWEDITAGLRQLIGEGFEWNNQAQDWYMWRSHVNAVTKTSDCTKFLDKLRKLRTPLH
jgi:hypothetical protein